LTPASGTSSADECNQALSEWSAGRVLAHRLLLKDNESLMLDAGEFARLTVELEQVIDTIQSSFPETPPARPLFEYVPGNVVIGLDPDYAAGLDPGTWKSFTTFPATSFGRDDIDQLNTRFGLESISYTSGSGIAFAALCFDELINPPAVANEFAGIPVISHANPNGIAGIPEDLRDANAVKQGDAWYVAIRDTLGECTTGCFDDRRFYFTVTSGSAQQVPAEQAVQDPILAPLAAAWGPSDPAPGP
jgi:hypothetical protein